MLSIVNALMAAVGLCQTKIARRNPAVRSPSSPLFSWAVNVVWSVVSLRDVTVARSIRWFRRSPLPPWDCWVNFAWWFGISRRAGGAPSLRPASGGEIQADRHRSALPFAGPVGVRLGEKPALGAPRSETPDVLSGRRWKRPHQEVRLKKYRKPRTHLQ
jgi:hypothetical protein